MTTRAFIYYKLSGSLYVEEVKKIWDTKQGHLLAKFIGNLDIKYG